MNDPKTALEYVNLIDRQFLEAKNLRLSRFSIEWGRWSREMNVDLRARIQSKEDPEELALKHVIIYWTLKSKILEMFYKSAILHIGQRMKLQKEAGSHKRMILTGELDDVKLD